MFDVKARFGKVLPVVLAAAGLAAWLTACKKETGQAGAAAEKGAAPAKEEPKPLPTNTPDPGERPSFRETAATGEAPFAAAKVPFEAKFDSRGRLWVLDSANSRVRLFDANGSFLGGWGGIGEDKQLFRHPEGIALSKDEIYVADTWNHRVERFSLAGEWKGSVGGMMGPRSLAVAPDGSVWVLDTGNNRVLKYDAALGKAETFGVAEGKPEEFKGPVGIAIAPSGTVYVTDTGHSRIAMLDKNGKVAGSWNVPWLQQSWQARLETDQNGVVYASYPGGAEVMSFTKTGAPEKHWKTDDSGEKFVTPIGLAFDRKAGKLHVMDVGAKRVGTITISGAKGR